MPVCCAMYLAMPKEPPKTLKAFKPEAVGFVLHINLAETLSIQPCGRALQVVFLLYCGKLSWNFLAFPIFVSAVTR